MNEYHATLSDEKVLHVKYDKFFKTASSPDIADACDGNVEAPTGWFALIDMSTPKAYDEVWAAIQNDAISSDYLDGEEIPDKGVYLTTTNNQGIIWAVEYSSRAAADKAFGNFLDEFARWDSEEVGDDDNDGS